MLGLATYILILAALFVATWRRPPVGLAAVLCLYGLKQWGQSTTALFSEYREFANFAVFLVTIIGVWRAAQRRSCLFCQMPLIGTLVFLLYGYALISVIWALNPSTSFQQWVISAPYILTITLLAPLLLNDLDDARTAFIATALAGSALCALALFFGKWGDRGLVLFGHQAMEDSYNLYRYETNPLALSTLGGTVFLIAALSLGRTSSVVMRVAAGLSIPIALAVILRSGSRGQLLACGVGLMVGLPIAFRVRRGRSFLALPLLILALAGLGWWSTSIVEIDSSRWSDVRTTQDVAGRLAMAEQLLGASSRDISTAIFGLGNSSAFEVLGIYPHITGLEVIAEEGVLGAIVYFAILVLAFLGIIHLARRPQLTDRQRNSLGILAGLFVFELILSWKQGSLLFSVYVFAYAIILARFEASSSASKNEPVLAETLVTPQRFPNLVR